MKLSDYFKPKWQRSDLQVRIEAIKKITNEYYLLSVINNDTSLEAQLEAIRMMNPKLENAHLEEAKMRMVKIGNYNDQLLKKIRDQMWNKEKILKDIIKGNYPIEVRLEALKIIDTTWSNLEELALYVTDLAVFKELWNKIKIYLPWTKRREIAEKLSNKSVINFLALNEDDSNLDQWSILSKIDNQDILNEIFQKSNNIRVKREILRHFKDQQLLFEIAINDKDSSICQNAIRMLKDEMLLMKIYNNESDPTIRAIIAESFSISTSEAAKIAKNDPDYEVRRKALEKLISFNTEKSQDLFYEIAANNREDISLRSIAIANLDEKIYGDYLYHIVRSKESCDLRIAVIEKLLKNKSKRINTMIEEIATKDHDIVVKNYATIVVKNYATQKLHYEEEIISKLRSLCIAYTKGDKTKISVLESEAKIIGKELNSKGGIEEMRRIYNKIGGIPGQRTLEMLWDGIGKWQG